MATNKFQNEKEWFKEFQSFLSAEAVPPSSISKAVSHRVHADLNPAFWTVLVKLGVIQLTVGAFTLLFCPQLGVGPVFGEHGLMYLFMHFGPVVCTAACGAIFFGLSLLFGLLLIRPEEFRVARKQRLVHIPALSAVSLMLLMVAGAEETLLFYAVWFFSAILSGEVSSHIAAWTRSHPLPKKG